MNILILGVSGMLGSAMFRMLSEDKKLKVTGTARSPEVKRFFSSDLQDHIECGLDVLVQDDLINVFEKVNPDIVINCIGLIKQLDNSSDPLKVLPINSLLPHRLASLCRLTHSRLIHMSTDCIFSGNKGMYSESDESDAKDLYGKSKYIGEVNDLPHVITLRTSIVGHELSSSYALVDWFLSQENKVKGYSRSIFSGVTTIELAKLINKYIIPQYDLFGVYHISADPIDKMSLLKIVSEVYGKNIEIVPDEKVKIDRSLDSSKFKNETGYEPLSWKNMINEMYRYRLNDR